MGGRVYWALSRQISIGHFRRRIRPSASAIHEQKQWGHTPPESAIRQYRIYSDNAVEHAENSARLANETEPEFLATLVVSFPKGEERFRERFPDFAPLSIAGLLREMELFVSRLELRRTVFRSDHASNWLALKGTLGADKARLLAQLRAAIAAPELAPLRPAWARGL